MVIPGLGSGYYKLKRDYQRVWYIKLSKLIGVEFFDTAPLYDTEVILGRAKLRDVKMITKVGLTTDFDAEVDSTARWQHFSATLIRSSLDMSLERLGVGRVYGYLLHCISAGVNLDEQIEALKDLKLNGKVEMIGFSIDHLSDLPKNFDWADLIEVPIGILYDVPLKSHQIIVINGVHRAIKGREIVESYCIEHPDQLVIALTGSSKVRRLGGFVAWARVLNFKASRYI